MTGNLLGSAMALMAGCAFIALPSADLIFRNLGQIKKLRRNGERLGEIVIDGNKVGPIKRGKAVLPAEKIRDLLPRQIASITLGNSRDPTRFRTLVIAADIIGLRPKAHKKLLREFKALSGTFFMFFVFGVILNLRSGGFLNNSTNRLNAIMSAAITSPISHIEIAEAFTIAFLLYRLVQEYRETRDLNEGP